jgi:hypothetical protein
MMTLQAQLLSNKALLTDGGASCNPTRQQFPKSCATDFICTAVSQQMSWQDYCTVVEETLVGLTISCFDHHMSDTF